MMKDSVGQAHTYPCGQVYDFDRREGVARPESKHQIIIIGGFLPKSALAVDLGAGIWAGHYYYNPTLVECGAAEDSV